MEIVAWDQNSRKAIHCVGVDFIKEGCLCKNMEVASDFNGNSQRGRRCKVCQVLTTHKLKFSILSFKFFYFLQKLLLVVSHKMKLHDSYSFSLPISVVSFLLLSIVGWKLGPA